MIIIAWIALISYILGTIITIRNQKETLVLITAFPLMCCIIASLVYLIILL